MIQVQDHADAILALLRADNVLTVYPSVDPDGADGFVPHGAEPPYVAVHIHVMAPAGAADQRLSSRAERAVVRAYCHCAGANDVAARAVAQRVMAALLNVKPVIAGRACYPIRHDDSRPPDRDESTGRLVMTQVDVYRLESVPAPA